MQDEYLQKIKNILLKEDRATQEILKQEIAELKHTLDNLEKLIEETAEPVVEKKVETEIKNSEEHIKEMMFPAMGQMVRKYIIMELEKLSERIDTQVDKAFSFENIKRQFIALIKGVKPNELIMDNLLVPEIQEVYVIEQDSGLLVGHYSKGNIVDQDMIAGMLTAIKAFVDDAFQKKTGSLDMIEHGTYKIILQNSFKFYIAIVVSGTVKASFRSHILDLSMDFADKHLKKNMEEIDETEISQILQTYFEKIEYSNQPKQLSTGKDSKSKGKWNWKDIFK